MSNTHLVSLVYGGNGALGKAIVEALNKGNVETISVDLASNEDAKESIVIQGSSMEADAKQVTTVLGERKVDAVFCVAGGWAGGNIASENTFSAVDKMWKFNVQSAVVASHIASHHLKAGGLLVLTGSSAALGATPGMIGYGIAKAATHQLVQSLADPDSKLPQNTNVIGILPITLDTPANRAGMPKADFSSWTPLSEIAQKFLSWIVSERPSSGSLLEIVTSNGSTKWSNVNITISKQ